MIQELEDMNNFQKKKLEEVNNRYISKPEIEEFDNL